MLFSSGAVYLVRLIHVKLWQVSQHSRGDTGWQYGPQEVAHGCQTIICMQAVYVRHLQDKMCISSHGHAGCQPAADTHVMSASQASFMLVCLQGTTYKILCIATCTGALQM